MKMRGVASSFSAHAAHLVVLMLVVLALRAAPRDT
jgi:hypothetical protein